MRTELMKDVKEFIKFNDLIHKDYDEVINEFSDENLTDEEMDEIEIFSSEMKMKWKKKRFRKWQRKLRWLETMKLISNG